MSYVLDCPQSSRRTGLLLASYTNQTLYSEPFSKGSFFLQECSNQSSKYSLMHKLQYFLNNTHFFDTRIRPVIDITYTSYSETSPCWLWNDWLNNQGYGVLHFKNKMVAIHRVVYTIFKALPVKGLVLDHLCRNRNCCNPDHLEEVTQKENVRRGNAGKHMAQREGSKTHCPKGHEYSEENTSIIKVQKEDGTFRQKRRCRTCNRDRVAEVRNNSKRLPGKDNRSTRDISTYAKPKKTHCKNGHPLTPDNIKTRVVNGKEKRRCLTCYNIKYGKQEKTYCPNGHPITETSHKEIILKDGSTKKQCIQCTKDRNKRYNEKNKSVSSPITHCKHGHSLEGDNLRMDGSRRVCKQCDRDRYRKKRTQKTECIT